MSTTPLFDAIADQFVAEIEGRVSDTVTAFVRETMALVRAELSAGSITDEQAAEAFELAIRLVVEDVPVDVGMQTMVSHALTHKGKPTS